MDMESIFRKFSDKMVILNNKLISNTDSIYNHKFPAMQAFLTISAIVLCFFLISTILPRSFKRLHPIFDQIQPAFTAIQVISLIRWIHPSAELFGTVSFKAAIILSCISAYLFIYRYAVTNYNSKHIFVLLFDFIIAIALLFRYGFLDDKCLTVISQNMHAILKTIFPFLKSLVVTNMKIHMLLFVSLVTFLTILVQDLVLSAVEPIRVKIRKATLKNRAIA
ncbi:hypothetical protein GINT2_000958 [Glugoides intestinalis]